MNSRVYVWDRVVRSFHWLLVLFFAVSYITGEEESEFHVYSGYTIAALVIIRVLWGFVGSEHARFSDFVRPPAAAVTYLKSLFSGRPAHYMGHNPAGGLMVLAMLACLSVTLGSGLMLYGSEGHGPLAFISAGADTGAHGDPTDHDSGEQDEEDEGEELLEEVHEIGVNLMLLLIAVHILGVAASSRAHRENLVRAMVTGYKSKPHS